MRYLLIFFVAMQSDRELFGDIQGGNSLDINFTELKKDDKRVTFDPSEKLILSAEGLGLKDKEHPVGGSVTTAPIRVGLAWRPTQQARIFVTISPASIVYQGGMWRGQLYARYSPDKVHWSSWLFVEAAAPKPKDKQVQFRGVLGVPEIESAPYFAFFGRYQQLDVPWNADEEAAVRWMLKQQPDFFARHLPFIGYVQFRLEVPFLKGAHLTQFDCSIGWGVSGLHTPPKDPARKVNTSEPWKFDATHPTEKE